jgi:cell division septum initiation protein DivIVA
MSPEKSQDAGEVQGKLDDIVAMVEQAKTKALSGSVVLNRTELLAALRELGELLPAQLSEARKVLRERRSLVESSRTEAERLVADARRQSDKLVEEARRTADRLLDAARRERQQLVEESSVLAEAEDEAEQLLGDARAQAVQMRAETDDYIDATLARFESLLEHTLATVGRGRDKLRELSEDAVDEAAAPTSPASATTKPTTSEPSTADELPGQEVIDLDAAAPEEEPATRSLTDALLQDGLAGAGTRSDPVRR